MPSVESHQDILFDINSFGGFLNLLIYDFGNIDKQDPCSTLAEILSFPHYPAAGYSAGIGNRRIHGASIFRLSSPPFSRPFFHADYQIVAFIHTYLKIILGHSWSCQFYLVVLFILNHIDGWSRSVCSCHPFIVKEIVKNTR